LATVAYIPNDPLASGGPPLRTVTAKRQPTRSAGFELRPKVAPGVYQPDTPEFGYWQAQEALIRGLRAWREVTGAYPEAWFGGQKRLIVLTDAGDDLNAFYDRRSLQFFHHQFGGQTAHSAESVDVVVHEEGHALLDMIRPDFFDVPFIEVGALHESFGDCLALLAALGDRTIRDAVVDAAPDLGANHFVEAVAEELGDAIRREFGRQSSEDGALRHALNTHRWTDPTLLPPNAPADTLSGEVHSFSRVFTGAFYDTIRNIHAAGPRTAPALARAARTAGKLLVSAIRTVPATPRVFEGVGRRMLSADVANKSGANVAAVRAAFEAHGISLPAPAVAMPVPLPGARTRGAAASRLRDQMGVPNGTRLTFTEATSDVDGGQIAHVAAYRPIEMTDGELAGVRLMVPAVARLRTRGRSVVGVLGDVLPVEGEAETEGRAFARALAANGDIRGAAQPAPAAPRRRLRGPAAIAGAQPARIPNAPFPPTHEIQVVNGAPTIVRVGFSCRACRACRTRQAE
jgi:hypothetical protein